MKATLTILISLMILSGCMQKKSVNRSSSSGNLSNDSVGTVTNGGGNTGGSSGSTNDGTEEGEADAGQTTDYYSLDNIVLHGTTGDNRYNPQSGPLWSSLTNISSDDQQIFQTDSRFNVRVRARSAPSKNETKDAHGNWCDTYPSAYTKLSVDVCVRKQTGSCIYTQRFSEIGINTVSKVKEFTVQSSGQPLVIDVLGVQWDYSCTYHKEGGGSETDYYGQTYCPMDAVWFSRCVKFDIQFATDYTKNFPASAPRY
ncbi:hypothetical protein [Bacteriovorax sp. Seq25_V]|uniref:hypothetical protein n=1 Tax=Bacteriovorax sp. Seq25_V TaxID=1201288 RepID=UPI00038A3A18|nr:hypothetical protein [Bacteriovorax sp. Seq25_V]EQC46650.1 putative lipoprotein [Bacteriovorax sp. Seq25_V]